MISQNNILKQIASNLNLNLQYQTKQNVQTFEKNLMNIRQQLNPQIKSIEQRQLFIKGYFQGNIKLLHQTTHVFVKEQQQNFQIKQLKHKYLMYYFQFLNLIVISLDEQKENNLSSLQIDLISSNITLYCQVQEKYYSNTFKNLLIFIFNLLKRLNSHSQTTIKENIINSDHIFRILKVILHTYLKNHTKKSSDQKFNQQTQWIGLIFQILPKIQWKKFTQKNSFLQSYFEFLEQQPYQNDQHQKISQFEILHILGNFIHLVIQSRTTTQIVVNFQCPIVDVKQMYNKPTTNKLCHLKLTLEDVLFICEFLKKSYNQEKQLFKQIFGNKQESFQKASQIPQEWLIKNQQEFQFQQKELTQQLENQQKKVTISDLLLETMNILNCILFIGGYNHQIQTIIYQNLFKNDTLTQFLELAYLLYNQKRFMHKKSPKMILAKPPDVNLSRILEIQYQYVTFIQKEAIFKLVAQEVKFGQLSVLLRLLTNLIHINKGALSYMQSNVKYLHMIMSLTHQSQMNLTMKNWAVLFIKNCCDSQKLRQEIGKVKVQMKVDDQFLRKNLVDQN